MENIKYKKIITVAVAVIIFFPSISLAVWWNPTTWFKKEAVQPPVVQVPIPIPISTNDKKTEKVKAVQAKEKKDVQPASKQPTSATSASPTTPSTGKGGGGAMGFSGVHLAVPLKCSDYKNYFTSISSCELIKKSSSANRDGVEIDPPLYTLCMQCLTSTPPVVINNSASNQVLPVNTQFYSVVSIVDGDTIKLNVDGKTETFRLIGMDTPETVDPRKEVQCFGVEASNKAKELLSGKKVRIETDPTQGTYDKYNRLLGYIYREDGLFYNKYMIENGFAHEYTYNTPYKYQTGFKNAQTEAQANKAGLWSPSTCNGDTTKTAITGSTPIQTNTTTSTDSCIIKGNISSSKEKIYHMVGCGSYNKTVIDESKGEKWFCLEKEATDAGWRKALNCN